MWKDARARCCSQLHFILAYRNTLVYNSCITNEHDCDLFNYYTSILVSLFHCAMYTYILLSIKTHATKSYR